MRRIILIVAGLMLSAAAAQAQTSTPAAEIFGGYSYLRAKIVDSENMHGWGISYTQNFGDKWGGEAEISGNYGDVDFPTPFGPVAVSFRKYAYLFGPRVTARTSAATVFGHALVGAVTTSIKNSGSTTNLGFGFGGGVDVNAGESFAIRVIQADYIPARQPDFVEGGTKWKSNFRVQVGFVLRLGQ